MEVWELISNRECQLWLSVPVAGLPALQLFEDGTVAGPKGRLSVYAGGITVGLMGGRRSCAGFWPGVFT